MMTVQLKEKYNTSMGTVLLVKNDRLFHVSEKVQTDSGAYIITGINFSTKPNNDDICLIVKPA